MFKHSFTEQVMMREISHTRQKCEAIKQKISERVAILGVTESIFNCVSR